MVTVDFQHVKFQCKTSLHEFAFLVTSIRMLEWNGKRSVIRPPSLKKKKKKTMQLSIIPTEMLIGVSADYTEEKTRLLVYL